MDLLDLIEAEAVSRPTDEKTADRVMLVAEDRVHSTDREMIVAAVLTDADRHGGHINPNRVRALLTSGGELTVHPRVLSAVYMSLARRGAIVPSGYVTNEDVKGGNAGKPLRVYRLADREAAA